MVSPPSSTLSSMIFTGKFTDVAPDGTDIVGGKR